MDDSQLTASEREAMEQYFDEATDLLTQYTFIDDAQRDGELIEQTPPQNVDTNLSAANRPRGQHYELTLRDPSALPDEQGHFQRNLEEQIGSKLYAEYDGGTRMISVTEYETYTGPPRARIMLFYSPEAARDS